MAIPHVIIIAEPDPIFGNMLRVEFTQVGFAVLMAASGPQAETYAQQTDARLVVLDTALPDLSSFEACARIRHLPRYHDTPIVLTARSHRRRQTHAAEVAGATLIMVKPYAFTDLITALERHIPADHPLMTVREQISGFAEPTGVAWGPLPPLTWQQGRDSNLSQNASVLPIVRGPGVRIPLTRKS